MPDDSTSIKYKRARLTSGVRSQKYHEKGQGLTGGGWGEGHADNGQFLVLGSWHSMVRTHPAVRFGVCALICIYGILQERDFKATRLLVSPL